MNETLPDADKLLVVETFPVKLAPDNLANPWLLTNAVVATKLELSLNTGVCVWIVPFVTKFPFNDKSVNKTIFPLTDTFCKVVFPIKDGDTKLAFSIKASCVAVEIGLLISLVLSTWWRPTIDFVIPPTFPINVGESKVAYLFIKDTPFS